MLRLRESAKSHTELFVLAAVLVAVVAAAASTGTRLGPGIYLAGAVGGVGIALHAAGLILVQRANRVINFAQIQMGAVAGVFFYEMVTRRAVLQGVARVCPPCLPRPKTLGDLAQMADVMPQAKQLLEEGRAAGLLDTPLSDVVLPHGVGSVDFAVGGAPGWMVQLNYWLSLGFAVLLATVLVWAVYALAIKRFQDAPRLVLAVITIASGALAQTLGGFVLRKAFGGETEAAARFGNAALPIGGRIRISPIFFGAADILAALVLVVVAVGLTVYLRRSSTGIAMRGAAENAERAETLGINVGAVTGRAWMLAGLFSGLAAVLLVARFGQPSTGDYEQLVRALGAVVVGGLISLPLAVVGALVLGVLDQLVLSATSATALVDVLLLGMIVVLLLAQRSRATRAEAEAHAGWVASRELRPIPQELRGLPTVRRTLRILGAVIVVVVVAYPWFMSPSQILLGTNTLAFAIVGLSLLVLTGWAGQISLAQVAFAAIGAWVTATVSLPFLLSIPLAALAGGAVAALVGIPALRLRGQHLAISTLALSVAVSSVVLGERYLGSLLPDALERPMLLGINLEDDRTFYYFALLCLAGITAATAGMRRSRAARALIACKDNEAAAQAFGINLVRTRLMAFALSGAMAAIAGSLIALAQHGVEPASFQPAASVNVFLVSLIGGLGAIAGPIIGALYLGMLDLLRNTAFADLGDLLLNPAVGILGLMAIMPGGMVQAVWALRDAWLRRLADRHRIRVPTLIADSAATDVAIPIREKAAPAGGKLFVPARYRLEGQWMVDARTHAMAEQGHDA